MITSFICLTFTGLITLLVVYPIAMIYSLILLFFVLTVITILSLLNGLTSFLPFILVSIYLGAMMIIIGYVCAVVPNVKLGVRNSYYWVPPITIFIVWIIRETPTLFGNPSSNGEDFLSLYFYSSIGGYFFIIIIILLLVLIVVPGLCVPYTAPLRSTSLLS